LYLKVINNILYQEVFSCTDLGSQLKPVMKRYQRSSENLTKIPSKDLLVTDEFDRNIRRLKDEINELQLLCSAKDEQLKEKEHRIEKIREVKSILLFISFKLSYFNKIIY
jgi:hypothetical protein